MSVRKPLQECIMSSDLAALTVRSSHLFVRVNHPTIKSTIYYRKYDAEIPDGVAKLSPKCYSMA